MSEEEVKPKDYSARGSMMAAWIGLCIVVGTYGSLALPIGGYVSGFWPAMALQAIGAIWFGWWGVIAAILFPLVSDAIGEALPVYVAATLAPANFFQAWIPGFVFRKLNLDPAVKDRKSLIWWIILVIIANLVGATLGTTAFVLWGLITWESQPLFWAGWFVGNTWPAIVFGPIILRVVTPFVERTRAYVYPEWW